MKKVYATLATLALLITPALYCAESAEAAGNQPAQQGAQIQLFDKATTIPGKALELGLCAAQTAFACCEAFGTSLAITCAGQFLCDHYDIQNPWIALGMIIGLPTLYAALHLAYKSATYSHKSNTIAITKALPAITKGVMLFQAAPLALFYLKLL